MALSPLVQGLLDQMASSGQAPTDSLVQAKQDVADKQAAKQALLYQQAALAASPAATQYTINPINYTAGSSGGGGGSYTPGNYGAPGSFSVDGWAKDVLKGIGAAVTSKNMAMMRAWAKIENGHYHQFKNGGYSLYNPINTTQSAPGATSVNSVGVKSYKDYNQGVNAVVKTLLNGRYGGIVQGLRQSSTDPWRQNASQFNTWGTGYGGWANGL